MKPSISVVLGLIFLSGLPSHHATTQSHFLWRRYVQTSEQEGPAIVSSTIAPTISMSSTSDKAREESPPARLYPDLLNLGPNNGQNTGQSFNQPAPAQAPNMSPSPTPFLPFRPEIYQAPNVNNASDHHNETNQQKEHQGIGQRLYRLLHPNNSEHSNQGPNRTVFERLEKAVHNSYDNLSKAYNNSTIQKQIEMLQQRLRNNTDGSSWYQHLSEQMTNHYKALAARANEAQRNLDDAWSNWRNANSSIAHQGEVVRQPAPAPAPGPVHQSNFVSSFDGLNGNNFFNNFGHAAALQMSPQDQQVAYPSIAIRSDGQDPQQAQNNIETQLREFWRKQVQPQIMTAQKMIAKSWRDFSTDPNGNPRNMSLDLNNIANGAREMFRSMMNPNDGVSGLDGPEYSIDGPNLSNSNTNNNNSIDLRRTFNEYAAQTQSNLSFLQNQVNQLWNHLSSSLSTAINRVSQAQDQLPNQTQTRPRFIGRQRPSQSSPAPASAATAASSTSASSSSTSSPSSASPESSTANPPTSTSKSNDSDDDS